MSSQVDNPTEYPAEAIPLPTVEAEAEFIPPEVHIPPFDLRTDPIPSFQALQQARSNVFRRRTGAGSLKRAIEDLGTDGEEGRRKGLGWWMLGEYEQAVETLRAYPNDDVASFTCANALMSLERPEEAMPIFQRLSEAYRDEPKPRGGRIEAQLESDLTQLDLEQALTRLEGNLTEAPSSFGDSAEAHYLQGRAAELRRDWESALESYEAARDRDPTHRGNLFRGAYLSERCGLDDEALELYEALASMLPIDRHVMLNLGVLYEDLGRDQDAAACYDTVLRCFPTDSRARLYFQDAVSAMDMYYDEELERKEDRLNQILRTPITDFELSVRARNCLNKMNIVTLGDLVKLTEQELLSYKNFGETSLNEIKEILTSKNLRLGMAHEEAVASIENLARPKATGENAELLNRSIAELELSIRARRTVENLGCLTLGDIVAHSEEELLGMPNFGVTSLQELKRKLSDIGLKLEKKPV